MLLLASSPILWTLNQLLAGPPFARKHIANRGEVGDAVLVALEQLGEASVREVAAYAHLPYDSVRQSLYRLRVRRLAEVVRRERLACGNLDVWAVAKRY